MRGLLDKRYNPANPLLFGKAVLKQMEYSWFYGILEKTIGGCEIWGFGQESADSRVLVFYKPC